MLVQADQGRVAELQASVRYCPVTGRTRCPLPCMGTVRAGSLTTGKNRSLVAVWANALLSPLSSAHGTTEGCGIPTVAKTVAKPLDGARRMWTTLEYRPSPRPVADGPGRLAHSYGSDGQ